MPSDLNIFLRNEKAHLPQKIVVTSRRDFVTLEKVSMIAAVRNEPQKFSQVLVRLTEFIDCL